LQGITAYREIGRDFAEGDRIQFTAPNRNLGVSNRDLGTIERIDGPQIAVKMDGEKQRTITFDSNQMRHFDHGYAVTSHSSQGLTTDRVLVNMDTTVHPELINSRFAYVSISRAARDAHIYTNDAGALGERLSTNVTKTSAVAIEQPQPDSTTNQRTQVKEPIMDNNREQSQDEQRRQFQNEANYPTPEKAAPASDLDRRHYEPIETALKGEASGYEWKRETGDIQSYQHRDTSGWLHIDHQGQFYDRQSQPISREIALENAGNVSSYSLDQNTQKQATFSGDQGFSL
jgi:hypothetical protein